MTRNVLETNCPLQLGAGSFTADVRITKNSTTNAASPAEFARSLLSVPIL
jgi:hypothetical protein